VHHENLLELVDYALTDSNIYIFTQYCEGGTLNDYIAQQKNSTLYQTRAFLVIKQIVLGYQQLYNKKIVHRDLKPANIMISDGMIKIGDFGFGKLIIGGMFPFLLYSPPLRPS
jgi:serine/threonine-protein kinase ULK/ATG1